MRAFAVPYSFSLLALACSHQVLGQEQSQQDDIYELITTAIHTQRSETALPVTVLSGDELHDAVRATLGDTLAGQPGISNASFGPAVGQTVIRGQQGRRVMNLSNSISNADASGNSADHAQTVEAILARSIEVLRGPSTLLYGGGAIGGVVNVIDNRIHDEVPDAPAFALETRHDTAADTSTVVGSADFATGNLVWHFDALQREWNDLDIPGLAIDPAYLEEHEEHEGEDHEEEEDHEDEHEHEETENTFGYIANTGGETRNATAGLSWILDNGHIGFAVSRLENEYGLPPGAHEHAHEHEHEDEDHEGEEDEEHEEHEEEEHGHDFVFIDMERTRYDLGAQWRDLAPWAETVDYRLSYTDYQHAEIEGTGEVGTRFSNEAWQQRLQLTHTDTPDRHGVLGLQYSAEEFAAIGEESFIPVTDIDSAGLFSVEDFHRGAMTLELGARYNRDSYSPQGSPAPDRDFNTWSFSGSTLWDYSETGTLGLSLSRSQRAPSAEELYSNHGMTDPEDCVIHFATGACEVGNADFDEESSLNADLTLYLDYGRFSATFTAFYNRFDDYIGQIDSGAEVDGFPIREYRQDDARFKGLEVDMNIELTRSLELRLFGDAIDGSFDTLGDVPRMPPPQRYGAELNYRIDDWSMYATVQHGRKQDQPGSAQLPTEAWTRVDVGADYRINTGGHGELLLFIKGRNLGDEEIRLSTSYLRGFAPEAGRSLETGLRWRY